jgi:hypothetical protein
MVMVVARSSAKAGIIAGMLAFVHTFTVGTINFLVLNSVYGSEYRACSRVHV